ncbi:ABC transporter ATP-binding protein [Georgenia alba]|uniref:ABC transporter ATP-binding protein n=1 Tax=Georgenia alba TaxID=2233858 RepID=A0ABW2QCC8_9MICO
MTTTTRTATDAVDVIGVAKQFHTKDGPLRAVDGVDLTIGRGEILALLGPNGAGKTTLLDMVLGLTTPTSGTISVLGTEPRRAVRAGQVSAVLQTGGLLRDLTVAETVRMIASTYDRHAEVDDVLRRARIQSIASRKVSKCSGGEQQRLRFALALLPDPDLLVLDEPTAGMDVTARREFWDTMREDAARGRTVVFATHYLQEADAFAQRIVMVSAGRVVADGPTAQIRARATGRTVSARLGSPTADVRHRLRTLPGVQDVSLDGGRVAVRAADSDAVALALLTDFGATDLEITSGSLDQAFQALTEGAS